jgi:hypothetical protein
MKRGAAWVAAAVVLIGFAMGRAAADTAVAVLGIEPQDVPEQLARELTEALRQRAAGAHGFAMVAGKDLVEVKLVFGCVDEVPACMAHAGHSLGADKVLFGTLKRAPSGFKVTLKWLDVAGARIENSLIEPIPAESANGPGIRALAIRWFATLSGIKIGGALQISTNVSGAEVWLDEKPVGSIADRPLSLQQLAAGVHQVRIEKSGYRHFVTRVRVSAGEVAQLAARLEPEAAPPPVPAAPQESAPAAAVTPPPRDVERPGHGSRIAFWSTVAMGAASAAAVVGFGLHTLSLEDDKTRAIASSPVDAIRNSSRDTNVCSLAKANLADPHLASICDDGSTSATLTNVFIGVGVASLAASAWFYYKGYMDGGTSSDRVTGSAARLRLQPQVFGSGGGGGIKAEFEF